MFVGFCFFPEYAINPAEFTIIEYKLGIFGHVKINWGGYIFILSSNNSENFNQNEFLSKEMFYCKYYLVTSKEVGKHPDNHHIWATDFKKQI